MKSRVEDIMTPSPKTCVAGDYLNTAAELMWEADVGCLPVVDDRGRLMGMITDRDICMAGYMQGEPLQQVLVLTAMAKKPIWVRRDDELTVALERMSEGSVRRLPVIDAEWQVIGMISLNDLVREARAVGETAVLDVLRAIGSSRIHRDLMIPLGRSEAVTAS